MSPHYCATRVRCACGVSAVRSGTSGHDYGCLFSSCCAARALSTLVPWEVWAQRQPKTDHRLPRWTGTGNATGSFRLEAPLPVTEPQHLEAS